MDDGIYVSVQGLISSISIQSYGGSELGPPQQCCHSYLSNMADALAHALLLVWLMSAAPQGGSSGADRGEEEVGPAGETQNSSAAVVQPREEGLHEAPPRGTRAHARTHTGF